jgi:GT2 family glycosyltransferase
MSGIPALIVPVLNRPDLLRRLLDSIDFPVDDLLIIDNGGVVGNLHRLPKVARTHVLHMPTNLGVAGSWNLGVKSLPFAPWWLIVNSDAYFPPGALESFCTAARTDALVLSAAAPPWAAFAIGEQVVGTVGLFDEALYPAYFEDTDYERRCTYHGIPVVQSGVRVAHDNSSTIAEPRYAEANARTFSINRAYYQAKQYRGDMTAGEWTLARRRELSWD